MSRDNLFLIATEETNSDESIFDQAMSEKEKCQEDLIIQQAMSILFSRMQEKRDLLINPRMVRQFLQLHYSGYERECFSVLLLDTQHHLLHFEDLFFGTIDGASVYPREVVKLALTHNAAAVIFSHNHPSGVAEPSRSDEMITERLKQALLLLDIRTLDHLVCGGCSIVSFAERGLL